MTTKILLADDSVTIQKVVELTFSDKNYEVTTVSDGESAIRRAREKRPDVILLDVIMPGMDGYEVCSILKQDPDLKEVPVLLLTGTFEVFDTERSQRVGANGYITKPFESQELIARVRRLVSSQHSEAAPAEEDLDDLMLPELEKDEPVELKKGSRQAMDEEDFPDFTFDTDTESTDSEILFDFSMDTLGPQGTQQSGRAVPARGAPAGRGPSAESLRREAPVEARGPAKPPGSIHFDEDDEPTFELPEFDLPDEGSERPLTTAPSLWDIEDQELSTNLAAITAPAGKGSAPKGLVAARPSGAEDSRFVFEEARELAKAAAAVTPPMAPVDLQPLLDRLEKLEAAVQRAAGPSPEAIQMLERMGRFESLLGEQKPAAAVQLATAEALEDAIQKRFPQILNRISETIQSKLPEIVDKAAEKLTGTVAAQFVQRLESGGLDSREIITAIAWQVVPDVAEMLVRRELEEIRRHI